MASGLHPIFDKVKTLYHSQTFGSRYGGAIWAAVVIIWAWAVAMAYVKAKNHAGAYKNDWSSKRCEPWIMPIAGWVHNPDPTMTASEATENNFTFCIGRIGHDLMELLLAPFYVILAALWAVVDVIIDTLKMVALLLSRLMALIRSIIAWIMGVIGNIATVFQSVFDAALHMMHRLTAVGTAAGYVVQSISFITISACRLVIDGMINIIAIMLLGFIILLDFVPLAAIFCFGCWSLVPAALLLLTLIFFITIMIITVYIFNGMQHAATESPNPHAGTWNTELFGLHLPGTH